MPKQNHAAFRKWLSKLTVKKILKRCRRRLKKFEHQMIKYGNVIPCPRGKRYVHWVCLYHFSIPKRFRDDVFCVRDDRMSMQDDINISFEDYPKILKFLRNLAVGKYQDLPPAN